MSDTKVPSTKELESRLEELIDSQDLLLSEKIQLKRALNLHRMICLRDTHDLILASMKGDTMPDKLDYPSKTPTSKGGDADVAHDKPALSV